MRFTALVALLLFLCVGGAVGASTPSPTPSPTSAPTAFPTPAVTLAPGSASLAVLHPNQDNTLLENVNLTNGGDDQMFVGNTNQANGLFRRRAIVEFDVSPIPGGSVVGRAELVLVVTKKNAQGAALPVTINRITSPWISGDTIGGSGGGNGAPPTTNSSNWFFSHWPSTPWTTPGGDFEASNSATATLDGLGTYNITGAGILSDVQGWVDGSIPNYGWLFKNDDTTKRTARALASGEATDESTRPALHVWFTPATPPTRQLTVASSSQSATLSSTLVGYGTTAPISVPIGVTVPAGTLSTGTTVTVQLTNPTVLAGNSALTNPTSGNSGSRTATEVAFTITASSASGQLTNPLTVSLTLAHTPKGTPELLFYDTAAMQWVDVCGSSYHTSSKVLTASVCHLSQFAVFDVSPTSSSSDDTTRTVVISVVVVVLVLAALLAFWVYRKRKDPRPTGSSHQLVDLEPAE